MSLFQRRREAARRFRRHITEEASEEYEDQITEAISGNVALPETADEALGLDESSGAESQLSQMSIDEETGERTGSTRYFIDDWEPAVIQDLGGDLRANNYQELDDIVARVDSRLTFDDNGTEGDLYIRDTGRLSLAIEKQFPTTRYPDYRHYLDKKTEEIKNRYYKDIKQFSKHPWFYATRPPRQLGYREVEMVLRFPVTNVEDQGEFGTILNLFRSQPNHSIYQSQMKIRYCGERCLLRSFTNLYQSYLVTARLFINIFNRDIKLADIIGNGRMTAWFQITIEKMVDINPKQLNKIVMTTEVISIPIDDEDGFPFLIATLSLYLASYVGWKISSFNEGVEYWENLKDENGELGHVSEVSMFVLRYPDHEGGCMGYFGNKYISRTLARYAWDPPSRNNNCFFYCVYKFMDFDDAPYLYDLRAQADREVLSFTPIAKVKFSSMTTLATHYGLYFKIYRILKVEYGQQKVSFWKGYGNKAFPKELHVRILYKASHFCLIQNIDKIRQFRSCPQCYAWFNITLTKGRDHLTSCKKCKDCGLRYSETHICRDSKNRVLGRKKVSAVSEVKKRNLKFTGLKGVFVADFETFQYEGEQHVYAAGFMEIADIKQAQVKDKVQMRMCYGTDALTNFCNHMLNIKCSAMVVFYNGSRFDFWFILRWLLKNKIKITELLREKKSNKIIKLGFGKVVLWDLCLFTLCSLKQLCKDFSLPKEYEKKEMDHTLIKTWGDAITHKSEVQNYLYYDVLSLGICYTIFAEKTWALYKWNVRDCLSLSHFAYDVWRNNFIERENVGKIKLPTAEEYTFLRRGLFGGRCMPYRKAFKSSTYISYTDLQLFDAENQTSVYEQCTDYLLDVDIVSLYPFVSKQKFPLGEPRWMTDRLDEMKILLQRKTHSTTELDLIRRSFVEVDVKCPRWISVPFLFSKDEHGRLTQDLRDKEKQVYDGETLLEAIVIGYRITRVRAWLLYPLYEHILDYYMTHCFDSKAKHSKAEAEYYIHKGMMNNCTGKFSQQVIDTEQKFFQDDTFIKSFDEEGNLESLKRVEALKDENNQFMGYYAEFSQEAVYSKPPHIGVCILAKSRILMSVYTRMMNGYGLDKYGRLDERLKHCPYYTDTDSLLIHNSTYLKHKECGAFGTQWGKLKDEYDGKCKIVAAYFPAPKTYAYEYWCLKPDGTIDVKWKMRAKGIPKGRDGGNETLCSGAKAYAELQESIRNAGDKPRDLNEILFSLYDCHDKHIMTTVSLPFYFYEHMMCLNCYVVVHFGKLKRYLVDEQGKGVTVKLNLDLHRSINKEHWWKEDGTGKRTPLGNIWSPTVPKGHIALT